MNAKELFDNPTIQVEIKEVRVFDARTFLKEMHRIDDKEKLTKEQKIRSDIGYMGRSWNWVDDCQGKTYEECKKQGYFCGDEWMTDIKKHKRLTQKQYNAICNKRIAKIKQEG